MTLEQIKDLYSMGFNKFHSCNSYPNFEKGARSGDILRPHVVKQIEYIKGLNPTNYCIAGGGIEYMEDISFYKIHGADAFSLGTVCFNPFKFRRLVSHVY